MNNIGELRTNGTIAIVGAGPAGATLAKLLSMRNFSVRVFERDASPTTRSQGGSLDLREGGGQRALESAGLIEAFRRASRNEAKAFKMIDSHGEVQQQVEVVTNEGAGPEIDRGDLRHLLLNSLPQDMVAWDHTVEDVYEEVDGSWRLEFTGRAPFVADLVVGADGVGSKVRARLTSVGPQYTGITMLAANIRRDLWRGSKLAETLGEGSVMFTGGNKTIFVQRCAHDVILLYYSMAVVEDWPKNQGFDLGDEQPVLAAIAKSYSDWSPHVVAMLTRIEGTFHRWPIAVMPPDYRWETRRSLTMIGDASHAMPPFTGKGVNLALLDALELADRLTEDPTRDVTAAISAFEKAMQDRTRKEIGECLEVGRVMYGLEMDFARPSDSARQAAS